MDLDLMMIVLLILLAVFLVVVEVLLIPGISVAIIGAIISACVAIGIAYTTYGVGWAMLVFVIALILSSIALAICMKKKNMAKMSLNEITNSTVAEKVSEKVAKGECGVTVTRLAPIGHITVGGDNYEAKSISGLVDPKTDVIVVGYEDNVLVVKVIEK